MLKEKTILPAIIFFGSTKVNLKAQCSKGRIDDLRLKIDKAYLGHNLFQTVRLLA
jgi:hypothetical protein